MLKSKIFVLWERISKSTLWQRVFLLFLMKDSDRAYGSRRVTFQSELEKDSKRGMILLLVALRVLPRCIQPRKLQTGSRFLLRIFRKTFEEDHHMLQRTHPLEFPFTHKPYNCGIFAQGKMTVWYTIHRDTGYTGRHTANKHRSM